MGKLETGNPEIDNTYEVSDADWFAVKDVTDSAVYEIDGKVWRFIGKVVPGNNDRVWRHYQLTGREAKALRPRKPRQVPTSAAEPNPSVAQTEPTAAQ